MSSSVPELIKHFVILNRKKKKDKELKNLEKQVLTISADEETTKKAYVDKRTPAQLAFDKIQEKRVRTFLYGLFMHSY